MELTFFSIVKFKKSVYVKLGIEYKLPLYLKK
uniref:Uncharacterized protein n=1 Tax=Anguilla anguilla TaxID=7936 RepID=A0A0E9SPF5_ANGAN